MKPEGRVAELLLRLKELEEEGRDILLQEQCRQYPELLSELERQVQSMKAKLLAGSGSSEPHGRVTAEYSGTRKGEIETVEYSGRSDSVSESSRATLALHNSTVPGYQILEALGKGGMGVVYKARHLKLNRVVALKMIKTGSHADEAELMRFRIEAETIARMQHPNVVQVFEVGEHGGIPFLSLEFCDGGDLGRKLKQAPPSPPEAARLVEMLALAIHAAHQRLVIHRDLKPANVLLTDCGVPKIADFGLAKRLEQEAGHTQTGTVVGTASYMAPEQARGDPQDLSPAVDTYALGAILYHCLTGEPPFSADSSIDTLMQVIDDEPIPPRQLQPKVPKDLETICLKCLRKAPARRYASARELADDLRRWQLHEPIEARPVALSEKAWLWCKRRPAVAGLLVGCFVLLLVVVVVGSRIKKRVEAKAMIEQLVSARMSDVPEIIGRMASYRSLTDPLLREALGRAVQTNDAQKMLHIRMALLPADATQVDPLYKRLLLAAPEDVPVIRDALLPHKSELRRRLWQVVEAGEEKQLLPAACALATYDPLNKQWNHASNVVADRLVATNPLHLGVWMKEFEPIQDQLVTPLKKHFQDPSPSKAAQREKATSLLAVYAVEQPRELAELLLIGDEKQFLELFPKIRSTAEAVEAFGGELARALKPMWKDQPLDPGWRTPPSPVTQKIEAAHGILEERFALCQTMPLSELLLVAEELRKSGYRPIRFRPHVTSGEIHVAAVWTRDDQEWQIVHGLTAEEIIQQCKKRVLEQYRPVDVCGYYKDGLRYAALWVKSVPAVEKQTYLEVGLSENEWLAKREELNEKGYRLLTCTRVADNTNSSRYSSIWGQVSDQGAAARATVHAGLEADYAGDNMLSDLQVDVSVSRAVHQAQHGPDIGKSLHRIIRGELASNDPFHAVLKNSHYQVHAVEMHPDQLHQIDLESLAFDTQLYLEDGDREALATHTDVAKGHLSSRLLFVPRTAGSYRILTTSPNAGATGPYKLTLQTGDRFYVAIWHPVAGRESKEIHGLDPAAHLARCRELMAQGCRPVSLSVGTLPLSSPSNAIPTGGDTQQVAASVWQRPLLPDDAKETLAQRQAKAALALLKLNRGEKVWPLLRHRRDPRLRSYVINWLRQLEVDAHKIRRELTRSKDVSVQRALLLALGDYESKRFSPSERKQLLRQVLGLYLSHPDPGVHGAAAWLLRKWDQQEQLKTTSLELSTGECKGQRRWYLNKQGQTLVVIPGPVGFLMGTPRHEEGRSNGPSGNQERQHRRKISHTFAISAYEVTVKQFLQFRPRHEYARTYSLTDNHPINRVAWYDAAEYCNWLSKQEGIPKREWCYEPNEEGHYAEGMKLRPGFPKLQGYRLPTEAEWEYACRAGALTSRSFGETEELLPHYAWFTTVSQNRRMLPIGSLKPNDLGIFDTYGNAHEWCQEVVAFTPVDPKGQSIEYLFPRRAIRNANPRLMRGSSFYFFPAVTVRSGSRFSSPPNNRHGDLGFRVARTLPSRD